MVSRAFLALCFAPFLAAQALPVPRKAADFTVQMPDGKKVDLNSYKGKVVVLNFIFTTCIHCQQMSGEMNQLFAQYGSQGFQPLAVAWNEDAKSLVPQFVKDFKITYPVGYSDRAGAFAYLGMSFMDQRTVVPQMVWIDRKGIVRAQTPPEGDPNMLTEGYFRKMITTLLAEPAAPATSRRATRSVH
jgi:peroxiredoxin